MDFILRADGFLRMGVIRSDLQWRENPRLQKDRTAWGRERQSGQERGRGGEGPLRGLQVSRPVRSVAVRWECRWGGESQVGR